LKSIPGKRQTLTHGFFRSGINDRIGKIDKKYSTFRNDNSAIMQSSVFASWLESSKFLLFPVLYFVIDYFLRNYVQVDILSSYWDEAILIGGFGMGIFRVFVQSKGAYGQSTPLGLPVLLFIGFFISLMLMNSPLTSIGIEGVRAVTQYMLWYFVAIFLIQSYSDVERLYMWFLSAGTGFALHGIYQFAANVPMPASWVDMAEKGVRTRSFSIIGSPNILGSIMTLFIPMALALFFKENKIFKKAMYGSSTALMCLCLVFTQSRGAWIGFAVAIIVFFLIYDKKYILPVVFAGLLIFLLVPQVYDRITYMLSKEYIMSSLSGGRLIRWQNGWELFKANKWLGLGIGRFGGAVAMNNKDLFPSTYYMDNYYLKLAVEGGLFALISFFLLMFSVLKWSLGALRNQVDKRYKMMITGMLSGVTGVMAHNFVENVFEVPAMVAYFWIIVAMIVFLGFNKGIQNT